MKKYYFRLGYSCNDNCWHCFVPMGEYKGDLSTEQAISVLERAKEDNVEIIALTGGEPTIRKDIFEIVQHAKNSALRRSKSRQTEGCYQYQDFPGNLKKAVLLIYIFQSTPI